MTALRMLLIGACLFIGQAGVQAADFMRGDANDDAAVGLSDAIYILAYQFTGGPGICEDSMDINDDGALTLVDPINILGYLFSAGSPPPPPFIACGDDPTADSLGCVGPLLSCGPSNLQGQFLDAAVSGLMYITGTFTAFTDNDGTFIYQAGDSITFMVGDIVFGSAQGQLFITPLDLVLTTAGAYDPEVLNILRFLQSIDDDANLDNGIQISPDTAAAAIGLTIDFAQSLSAFSLDPAVIAAIDDLTTASMAGPRPLVSSASALCHFQGTLGTIGAVSNSLSLSGPDSAIVGNILAIGPIESDRADLVGTDEAIVVLDECSVILPVGSPAPFEHADLDNGVVMIVLDQTVPAIVGISMTILINGVPHGYVCSSSGGPTVDCGNLSIDFAARIASFIGVTVENVDTGELLIIDGVLTW